MGTSEADAEKRSAELRKKIEYQVACEERAHRIVERLIDNPVTQEQLINALHFITQGHYSDIVEERAVSKLCGYPLCPNSLANIPKQKYMISTKTNTVYDIESRKNFCSPKCYKASKHLEIQVSNDPVWSRKNVRPTQFDLLPLDMKSGKIGDEVVVSKSKEIIEDLGRLERLEKYEKNLAERIHKHNLEQQKPESSETCQNIEERENAKEGSITAEGGDVVVYTLDKAMDEMSIEDKENGKDKALPGQNVDSFSGTKTNVDCDAVDTYRNVDSGNVKCSSREGEHGLKEKVKCQDIRGNDGNRQTESKHSRKSKVSNPSKSKTDYLMHLLDKRKALLANMADIQNDPQKSESKSKIKIKNTETETTKSAESKEKEDVDPIEKISTLEKTADNTENIGAAEKTSDHKEKVKAEQHDVSIATVQAGEVKTTEKTYCKTVAEKKTMKERLKNAAKDETKKKSTVSALDIIYRSVESWITEETIEFFRVNEEITPGTDKAKTEFEKQYQELVAKVDAQEKDFDGLLGEESMEPDNTDRQSAPLPHFDVLRQEMEEDQARVKEFMKGSFTYKVREKQQTTKETDGTLGVVLPTVDRYDQMLIRQKIVLDRISKVLPDMLFPLHLLIQDVFTDLRKLICTFNLTSDNIIFKPAEWTLVTLILLRMLSRTLDVVWRGFKSPGADRYFTVLLSSLGSSIDNVDQKIDKMLENCVI